MSDRSPLEGDSSAPLHVRIARHLLDAGIRVGDSLPSESELGARLGMGRQQIREGLGVLEAFGTVAGRQGARRTWRGYDLGAVVSAASSLGTGDERSVRELLEVRHALETALLPTVAVRLTPEDLDEPRALAERMIELAEQGRSFSALDARFHRRLFAPLGNAVLDGILAAFWTQFDAAAPNPGAAVDPDVARMHLRIVDALAAGDHRLAVHELDAHFYGVRHLLDEEPDTASTEDRIKEGTP